MRPVPPGLLTVNVPPENSRGSDSNALSRNPGYGLHGPNSIRTQRFIRAGHTSAVKLVMEDNVAEKKIIAVLGATGAQGGGMVRASSMIRTLDSLRERSPETSTEPRRRNWRSWARKS